MKYFETIAEYPKAAGMVRIEIATSGESQRQYLSQAPLLTRENDVITIFGNHGDAASGMKLYTLRDGSQFLCTVRDRYDHRHLYFGGTDEQPFLVELDHHVIEGLVLGEEGFYETLKPSLLKEWEKKFTCTVRRQGDFFAMNIKKFPNLKEVVKGCGKKIEIEYVADAAVRGTRHLFTGLLGTIAGQGNVLVGEGVMQAPDHEPIELKRPHFIMQAVHIVDPENAD